MTVGQSRREDEEHDSGREHVIDDQTLHVAGDEEPLERREVEVDAGGLNDLVLLVSEIPDIHESIGREEERSHDRDDREWQREHSEMTVASSKEHESIGQRGILQVSGNPPDPLAIERPAATGAD